MAECAELSIWTQILQLSKSFQDGLASVNSKPLKAGSIFYTIIAMYLPCCFIFPKYLLPTTAQNNILDQSEGFILLLILQSFTLKITKTSLGFDQLSN